MGAQAKVERRSGIRLYALLAILGLVIVVALCVFPVFSRKRESARMMAEAGWASEMARVAAPERQGYVGKAETGFARGGGGFGRGGRVRLGAAVAPETPAPGAERAEAEGFEARAAAVPGISPMLIRTASLRMRVEDVRKAHDEVARIAREAKGYVADTTLSGEAGPMTASVTIRVPAEGLDSVIARIAALGKLLRKEISTEEVTEEYVDLTSRRRNLEREEERLLDLLKRAGKVKDLLEVEQTLARVRGEIETIAGRMRYLENRVALSTVHVELQGPEPKPTTGGPVWTARDTARQAARSLLNTGRGLGTMAIWIGIYAPVWLPLLLLAIWLIRRSLAPPRKPESAADP